MSNALRRNPHALAWTLSLLAAPFIYLLSFPPIYFMATRPNADIPEWLQAYGKPYMWLHEQAPFMKGPVSHYELLWYRIMRE